MNKKYELLTDDTIKLGNTTLYRIKALKDFGNVKKGDIGGYIEKESNLSHEGNCWVYGNAVIRENAKVYGNAEVFGNAKVFGNAYVFGDAKVFGTCWVYRNANVYGNAEVYGNARVFGNAYVFGDAVIHGGENISHNAYISSNNDYLYISSIGSRNGTTTFFKTKDGLIYVNCGCFSGTLEKFEKKVEETHKDNKYGKEYKLAIDMAKTHMLSN